MKSVMAHRDRFDMKLRMIDDLRKLVAKLANYPLNAVAESTVMGVGSVKK
ncbi:hypothetical protein M4951_19200 [Blastopirellula sp. J2-11]|nr:hypothetical protein [Blastopirellula sp. J2-11]UUO05495.1 hypothetical protein M4951_19200 [Blastopirellula sp. J2-11]